MAERFLRAATGAAAPEPEKVTYANFLPNWGDPGDIAQNKIDTFLGHIKAKAKLSVSKLQINGSPMALTKALELERNIERMILEAKRIIPKPPPKIMTPALEEELKKLRKLRSGY
jgi:hypothetical protein